MAAVLVLGVTMSAWQLAVILAAQTAAWFLATWLTERRALRREAVRAVIDQKLTEALRDLFEQRDQHTKEQ